MEIEDIALKQIKEAESALIRLETQMEGITNSLAKDYGLNSIEEANTFLDTEEKKLDETEIALNKARKELEEGYEWK